MARGWLDSADSSSAARARMMAATADFGADEARRLRQILARRAARDALGYAELAGFLFAVAAAPERVQPSEWLDLLMADDPPLFAEPKLFEEALPLMMALYDEIRRGVAGGRPMLPEGCAPRPGGRANLDRDAPLSLWARGFLDGHDWLAPLWAVDMPDAFDAGLETVLVGLCFFAAPEIAAVFHRDHAVPGEPLEAMAARLAADLPASMARYVALARELAADGRDTDAAAPGR